jgi:hypothetical protein
MVPSKRGNAKADELGESNQLIKGNVGLDLGETGCLCLQVMGEDRSMSVQVAWTRATIHT